MNGEPIGSLGDGEAVWHTDMSYLDVPPKASMLYALEVPPAGGNTVVLQHVRDLRGAAGALKDRIAGLKIKHDGTYNSGGYVRQGVTPTDDPRHLARRRASAGVHAPGDRPAHALSRPPPQRLSRRARRSPNPRRCSTSCGASSIEPEFAWEHVWRVGDLVLWDNRCTMHRRDAFDPNSRRIMHRTQVKGEQRPGVRRRPLPFIIHSAGCGAGRPSLDLWPGAGTSGMRRAKASETRAKPAPIKNTRSGRTTQTSPRPAGMNTAAMWLIEEPTPAVPAMSAASPIFWR